MHANVHANIHRPTFKKQSVFTTSHVVGQPYEQLHSFVIVIFWNRLQTTKNFPFYSRKCGWVHTPNRKLKYRTCSALFIATVETTIVYKRCETFIRDWNEPCGTWIWRMSAGIRRRRVEWQWRYWMVLDSEMLSVRLLCTERDENHPGSCYLFRILQRTIVINYSVQDWFKIV